MHSWQHSAVAGHFMNFRLFSPNMRRVRTKFIEFGSPRLAVFAPIAGAGGRDDGRCGGRERGAGRELNVPCDAEPRVDLVARRRAHAARTRPVGADPVLGDRDSAVNLAPASAWALPPEWADVRPGVPRPVDNIVGVCEAARALVVVHGASAVPKRPIAWLLYGGVEEVISSQRTGGLRPEGINAAAVAAAIGQEHSLDSVRDDVVAAASRCLVPRICWRSPSVSCLDFDAAAGLAP